MLLACRDAPPPAPTPPPAPVVRADVPVVRDVSTPTAPHDAGRAPTVRHVDASVQPQPLPRGSGFLGLNEAAVLARICNAPVERIERNRGGSTISYRVWFAGGERGLFKPQQRSEVANYRAELAAYRMSGLLGLDRVPPACGRTMPRAQLQRVADASGDAAFSQRVMTELLGRGDEVPGAMLYWVPGALEPVPGVERYPTLLGEEALAADDEALAADLSALLVFDFLNDNVDRWSGGNILRPRRAPGTPPAAMLFMDNGASFSAVHEGLGARPEEQATRIDRVARFPRRLIETVRGLTSERITAAVAADPLGPCLSPSQVSAVLTRRDRLIRRVDAAIAARGAEATLHFP